MVSEPQQWSTYAAAVSGEASQEGQTVPPMTASPIHAVPTTLPQTQRHQRMEDFENPFHFSSSDSSNAILVNPPLIGSSNYSSWSISMRIALEVKNKWCIVDGSISTPNRENSQYRCNLMVCSWIFKSVDSSIAQSVMHLDKAADVWDDLKKRFAQCDAQRISTLQNEIYSLRQKSLLVSEYYTRCWTMWEEMNTLRPLPICKCDPGVPAISPIKSERNATSIRSFVFCKA
ncbi:PREDICTED: uncharacterized protein LOC109154155 [Ipomoea nil]|uniref:uncharacterized protein LOC109154155 n=1 Tax=Ipomoea nil TaxID=35883 RepID=UPI0009017965|nr:PREDICTED: uncharacterized protein LOC109154155 [Ipomoea nil]